MKTGGPGGGSSDKEAPALTGLRPQIRAPELSLDDFIVQHPPGEWQRRGQMRARGARRAGAGSEAHADAAGGGGRAAG